MSPLTSSEVPPFEAVAVDHSQADYGLSLLNSTSFFIVILSPIMG